MLKKEMENLVKKAKGQDPDAFTELIQMHMKDMYKVALARKEKINITSLEEYEEPCIYDQYNPELKEVLSVLDEKYRIILTLFYVEGYHIKEIAKILKIPRSTVSTRLQRGRDRLAKSYKGSGKE